MSLVIQNTGLERNTLDKFYTKSEIVELCITTINEHLKIKKSDVIIEPSAGNGSFSKPLKDMFKNVIALDLAPEDSAIIKQDFFDFDPKSYEGKTIHIIGNPPFGRQSSIAKKFIKRVRHLLILFHLFFPNLSRRNLFKMYSHYIFI